MRKQCLDVFLMVAIRHLRIIFPLSQRHDIHHLAVYQSIKKSMLKIEK